IAQTIQGSRGPAFKPVGGRQIKSLEASIPALRDGIRSPDKEFLKGARSQTCLAKGHLKNKCSPKGRAPFISFQRKNLVFGEHSDPVEAFIVTGFCVVGSILCWQPGVTILGPKSTQLDLKDIILQLRSCGKV
ncbi:hypothetical protein AT2G14945, partial [Arabidopsis thaliana]